LEDLGFNRQGGRVDSSRHASCPNCAQKFELARIAEHPEVEPIGMQIEDTDHNFNFYYFNHVCAGCGSTFLVPVQSFLPFIQEPVPDLILTGSEECERHCLDVKDLQICSQPCTYAPFRRHLLAMRCAHIQVTEAAGKESAA
jgi:hypothetical protein